MNVFRLELPIFSEKLSFETTKFVYSIHKMNIMQKVHIICVIKSKTIKIVFYVFLVGLCIYCKLCKVAIKMALEK